MTQPGSPKSTAAPPKSQFTLIVITRAVKSVSWPPFAVPPLSCTLNVKLANAIPVWLTGGIYLNLDAKRSATGIDIPAVTLTPLSFRLPKSGIETICTAFRAFGGLSLESLKGKSPTPKMVMGVVAKIVETVDDVLTESHRLR